MYLAHCILLHRDDRHLVPQVESCRFKSHLTCILLLCPLARHSTNTAPSDTEGEIGVKIHQCYNAVPPCLWVPQTTTVICFGSPQNSNGLWALYSMPYGMQAVFNSICDTCVCTGWGEIGTTVSQWEAEGRDVLTQHKSDTWRCEAQGVKSFETMNSVQPVPKNSTLHKFSHFTWPHTQQPLVLSVGLSGSHYTFENIWLYGSNAWLTFTSSLCNN